MASLDDIAFVQIALNTAGVERADFGTPMIVGPLMAFPELVRSYSRYDDAVVDGLPEQILIALSDAFAQTPHPRFVKVGRRAVSSAVININPVNLTQYSITFSGTSPEYYTFTSDATATAAEIATGLALAITSDTNETVIATAVGNTVTLSWISQSNLQGIKLGANLSWGTITPLNTVAVDMTAIKMEDNAWYGLIASERIKQTQIDFAAWTETQEKMFITSTNEADMIVAGIATDLGSVLKNTQYFRTAVAYHATAATEYADAAWMSKVFTIPPGSETFALKRLASVTPTKLTTTQRNAALGKNGNTFEYFTSSIALATPGKTAAGEWMDVIRGRDWLKDLIQTNMAQMMINRNKVPYTDAGIQLCANNLRKSLQAGVTAGFLAPEEVDSDGNTIPSFTIYAPLSSDVDSVTKASRVLSLTFQARLAGAIHLVNISGSVGYELN